MKAANRWPVAEQGGNVRSEKERQGQQRKARSATLARLCTFGVPAACWALCTAPGNSVASDLRRTAHSVPHKGALAWQEASGQPLPHIMTWPSAVRCCFGLARSPRWSAAALHTNTLRRL